MATASPSGPSGTAPSLAKRLWDSPWCIMALLAIPGIGYVLAPFTGTSYHDMLHPTGEFSARMLVLVMIISPLRAIFPSNRALLWLAGRRRHIGVASFAYGVLHGLYYLMDLKWSGSEIYRELFQVGIGSGWLALILFLPLAITSNDISTRKLGFRWKHLHRLVYLAAALTLLHWLVTPDSIMPPAFVHFTPLAIAEAIRVFLWLRRRARRQVGATATSSPDPAGAAGSSGSRQSGQ